MAKPIIKWSETAIKNEKVGRTKKITGTRFAAILGKNRWSTPFEVWAEITGTFAKPFVQTIYTEAGKFIEPKQIEWYKVNTFANVLTPEQRYGFDPFKKTYGDFFRGLKKNQLSAGNFDDPKHPVLGGMWDALELDNDGNIIGVIECKSTKRAQDWTEEEAPEYYEYQAALYAYLLGIDKVTMIVTFLDEEDYHGADGSTTGEELFAALDKMKKTVKVDNSNTQQFSFKISERYPQFEAAINYALEWHEKYVKTGQSPNFDLSTKDKEIVRALSTEKVDDPELDISKLADQADGLLTTIATLKELNGITELEKQYSELKDKIKTEAMKFIGDDQSFVELVSSKNIYTIAKQTKTTIDADKLKADGLYDLYLKQSESIVLRVKENK